ncbi:hypothetical protein Tco_0541931, partial [Tanacetum coccineum]
MREDHGTSGDAGASIGRKSLTALQDSSLHSSTNVADAEVASLVRFCVPPPPVMAAAVTTTNIADAS